MARRLYEPVRIYFNFLPADLSAARQLLDNVIILAEAERLFT